MQRFRGLVGSMLGCVTLGLVVLTPAAVVAEGATPWAEDESMGSSAVPEVIENYVAALNAHDGKRAAAFYTEDAEVTQAVQNGNTFTGRDQIADWVDDNVAGLPDLEVTIGSVVQSDDRVAWEWTYSGSYTGQFPGAPVGEGQSVVLRGVSVMELNGDGLIARETLYFDNLSFFTQIGVTDYPTTPVSGGN